MNKLIFLIQKNKSTLQLGAYLIILYILLFFLFSLYFGWIDDVFMINYLKGTFYGKPDNALFIDTFLGWSILFKKLYVTVPAFPWFESSVYLLLALAIARSNIMLVNHHILAAYHSTIWKYLLLTLINIALFLHLVQLSTFTSVCILSSGIFLVSYFSSRHRDGWVFFLLFVCAFLMRPLLALPAVLIICCLSVSVDHSKFLKLSPVVLVIALSFFVQSRSSNPDIALLKSIHGRAVYLLDGQNSPLLKTKKTNEDIRQNAFFSWFCGDIPQLYSDSFLKKLEPENKLAYHTEYFKEDILAEIQTSASLYDGSYALFRNWRTRGLLLFALLVATSAYVAACAFGLKRKLAAISIVLLFVVVLFFIAGFMKMEERFFYPTCLALLFALLSIDIEPSKTNFSSSRLIKNAGLISLLVLAVIQIKDAASAHQELEKEYGQKRAFIEEINNSVNNKIVFFDTWSMGCIHSRPFEAWSLPANNQYTCYGETWSNFLKPHMDYLGTVCSDPQDMKVYFDCLSKRKDVLFLISSFRAEFLENYLYQVHHLHIHLRKINHHDAFDNLHYSFLPYRYDFGLYEMEQVALDIK